MTPQAALIELLGRVGALAGHAAYVTEAELILWPPGAVSAMKSQRLLATASPATSAVCSGCERACAMPVYTRPDEGYGAASFIACDKRSDTSQVPVSAAQVTRWRCPECRAIGLDGSLRIERASR